MEDEETRTTDWGKVSLALAIVAILLGGGAMGLFFTAPQGTTRLPQTVDVRVLLVAVHIEGMEVKEKHYFIPGTIVAHVGDILRITLVNMDEHNHSLAIPALGLESPRIAGGGEMHEFPSVTLAREGSFLIVCAIPYIPPNDCGEDHDEIVGQLLVLA